MDNNVIPQRGVHFDDFIGTMYLKDQKGLENVQLTPVFCGANDKHDDDFVGIRYSGYDTVKTGKLQEGIMYPAKNFTAKDLDRLFTKVEAEDGTIQYRPKASLSLDEVYIRVCYKTPGKSDPDKDNLKWVAAIDGGEVFALSGEKRTYVPKDAEL